MLYAGQNTLVPTRLAPESDGAFAVPYGSLLAGVVLVSERPDNARLEGLGCEGDRLCHKCESARLQENRVVGVDGLRGDSDFSTDEDLEYAAATVGYLEEAIPRLQALADQAAAAEPPTLFAAWFSSSYYQQFVDIGERALEIMQARPENLSRDAREALSGAAGAVVGAINRAQAAGVEEAKMDMVASILGGVHPLGMALAKNREVIERAARSAGAAALETIERAKEAGAAALSGFFGFAKYAGIAVAGVLLLALYGRARG